MPDEVKDKIRGSLKDDKLAPLERGSGFFAFYSFDLVNSTRFKSLNPSKWPFIFNTFHESSTDALRKRLSRPRLWKRLGDEVLLYQQIFSIQDIYTILPSTYKALQSVIQGIHNSYPPSKTILSVKATVWFAAVDYVIPQALPLAQEREMRFPNLVIEDYAEDEAVSSDFLGPDIDLGFRISKFAERGRIVVGAELAYLLFRESTQASLSWVNEKLKIVSYERLKGIWDDRYYPVIWYEENWNPKSMFLYDEEFTSVMASKIKENKTQKIEMLPKIFRDLDKEIQLERILDALKTGSAPQQAQSVKGIAPSFQAEIHCVAVCFNEDGRILIAKRSSEKRRLPNIWEFGCGQLKFGQTFEECLRQSYEADFNAKLEFYGKVHPVSCFTLDDPDEGRKIPGIIFIARITNPNDVRVVASNHADLAWFNPAEPDSLGQNETVENFSETVRMAAMRWKEFSEEKQA